MARLCSVQKRCLGDFKMNPQSGDICRAIDKNGEDAGLVIFLEKIPPYSLKGSEAPFYNYWNLKVLMQGEIRYLDTNGWTLIQESQQQDNRY